jgi:hypothetical protein
MKYTFLQFIQNLLKFQISNQWGRGWYKKSRMFSKSIYLPLFLGLVIGALVILNCGPTEQIIQNYPVTEKDGIAIVEKIILFDIDFPPKQLYKNQFIIKDREKIIPHFSEIVETHPDKSIKKARFIWVVNDIQPHETRDFQILAYSGRIPRPKYIEKIGNDYLTHSAFNLKFLISSNGLSEIHNFTKIQPLQDITQITGEDGIGHCSLNQSDAQIKVLQQDDFCSQLEIMGIVDSVYSYSQIYTIFHQIPLILCNKKITIQKDCHIQLAEIQSFNMNHLPNFVAIFYGWKKLSSSIQPNMDVYDYQIAKNPASYLFLQYLNNEVRDIKYHFVERRKANQKRNNLLTTIQIDSSLSLSFSVPGELWKKHSTFHVAKDTTDAHISWHWHGFQKREHWNRFYRQTWNEFWPAGTSKTFRSILFFHSPALTDKNFQEILNNYKQLTDYFN